VELLSSNMRYLFKLYILWLFQNFYFNFLVDPKFSIKIYKHFFQRWKIIKRNVIYLFFAHDYNWSNIIYIHTYIFDWKMIPSIAFTRWCSWLALLKQFQNQVFASINHCNGSRTPTVCKISHWFFVFNFSHNKIGK